ncbi:uncharacterized protein LOC106172988 isoform X3 [Lingula anatina]|uniref:Uncharacterized protein LOC106172988 isoform X3 n=1 Tax=Lingula anatina TaxID=7574 RepID=A0A1S3JHN3_LINAN|nr:uncharacterized protein LOC106172988 isoform X3 [Lingula anatina]|eukprot:XP_013409404.1 uncharacterized protein LOC106172988 isoform X3 [Lingula anatina]
MTLNMVLYLFTLLSFFALPMVAEGERMCAVYTMISHGSMIRSGSQEFASEQWYKIHRYFGRNTNASIAAEGRKFLQFLKEWYGIDVYVADDTLSGVDPTPVFFETMAVNFTFKIVTLPQSANFRLNSESRDNEVRFYDSQICLITWWIVIKNEFTVTEGRNQGMVVPASSMIGLHYYNIKPGHKGFDSEIKLRGENRVPVLSIPTPLGQDTNLTGYDITEGTYVVYNQYVTSLTRPEFGDGVARGISPRYVHGNEFVNDGRMVVTFYCNRTEFRLP